MRKGGFENIYFQRWPDVRFRSVVKLCQFFHGRFDGVGEILRTANKATAKGKAIPIKRELSLCLEGGP